MLDYHTEKAFIEIQNLIEKSIQTAYEQEVEIFEDMQAAKDEILDDIESSSEMSFVEGIHMLQETWHEHPMFYVYEAENKIKEDLIDTLKSIQKIITKEQEK